MPRSRTILILLLLVIVCMSVMACAVLVGSLSAKAEVIFGAASPNLNAFDRISLSISLISNIDNLQTPTNPNGKDISFSIESGDSAQIIIQKLSDQYKPERVVFITNVDGLYSANPTLDKSAELITELTDESFSKAVTSQNVNPDVTGSIHLKAKIALAMAKSGVEVSIINGNEKGRLTGALNGDDVIGTVAKA